MPQEPYQTLSSRVVWRTPWYILREDRIRLPDGSDGVYTVVERPGAVWIVPLLSDGRMVLIRNYRYTVRRWLWEVPAGGLPEDRTPEETARKELSEEIGGQASGIELVATFYTTAGISNERAFVFLARGVTLGQPDREPTEVMERHIFPVSQVMQMIRDGTISDGPSALAILLCAPHFGFEW